MTGREIYRSINLIGQWRSLLINSAIFSAFPNLIDRNRSNSAEIAVISAKSQKFSSIFFKYNQNRPNFCDFLQISPKAQKISAIFSKFLRNCSNFYEVAEIAPISILSTRYSRGAWIRVNS
jgi:hypothetical protein